MYYQFRLDGSADCSQLYPPYADRRLTWDEAQQLRVEDGELDELFRSGMIVLSTYEESLTGSELRRELMSQVQETQNKVLAFLPLMPDDMPGLQAVKLAYESLRLAWYMMQGDSIGVEEKSNFVKLAYERLAKSLEWENEER